MKSILRVALTGVLLIAAASAWGHVVVTPQQAGAGSWLTFSVSMPNEKDVAATELKLVLPAGIRHVTPTVKPGWAITIQKRDGEVTAITWKGQLPAGFRDDFTFSAQAPATAASLAWKAYQTYQGGIVVGWDVDPSSPDAHDPETLEKTGKGPYSVTRIVDDLTAPAAAPASGSGLPLALAALVLSVIAAVVSVFAWRRR